MELQFGGRFIFVKARLFLEAGFSLSGGGRRLVRDMRFGRRLRGLIGAWAKAPAATAP